MDKFLNIFQGKIGSEGRASQVLETALKAICPQTNDVVFFGDLFKVVSSAKEGVMLKCTE